MSTRLLTLCAWFSLAIISSCGTTREDSETRPVGQNVLAVETLNEALTGHVDFQRHVKPVLETKCAVCHNQAALPGRMSLASRDEAEQTGTLKVFIIPGQPKSSPFLTRLGPAHASLKEMPPVGERLTSLEVTLLERWIEQGAFWPQGTAGNLKTTEL